LTPLRRGDRKSPLSFCSISGIPVILICAKTLNALSAIFFAAVINYEAKLLISRKGCFFSKI
jgi:hypothetical protein